MPVLTSAGLDVSRVVVTSEGARGGHRTTDLVDAAMACYVHVLEHLEYVGTYCSKSGELLGRWRDQGGLSTEVFSRFPVYDVKLPAMETIMSRSP